MRLDAVSDLETRAQICTHSALDTGASRLMLNPLDGNLCSPDQIVVLREKDVYKRQEYKRGGSGDSALGYLKYFPRDGEVCLAVYQLRAEFTNPLLKKILPGVPEGLFLL